MKIAFIVRATLFTAKGGDTLQVVQIAKHLNDKGVSVEILLTHEKIDYEKYDLLHFFNLIRPADILKHIRISRKPFAITPILVNYSEYDKYHRGGWAGRVFQFLSPGSIEYFKTIARWVKGNDRFVSLSYLWKGHTGSMRTILKKASLVFTHVDQEWEELQKIFPTKALCVKVPNGIESSLFKTNTSVRDSNLVLCAARIEGIKNQLTLIRALNNTSYRLLIIGAPAPNQLHYYNQCIASAASNITFIDHLPQESLLDYYRKAKVHVLPSWFEACGLSSLEAGAMGCNVVITDKGYASSYFGDMAFSCDPASPESIFSAIDKAAKSDTVKDLRDTIIENYTWEQAALKIMDGYNQLLRK